MVGSSVVVGGSCMEGSSMRSITETAELTGDAEILAKLTALFRDVFDDQTIVPQLDTTADDIAGWDSMSQVRLAVEIEHRFAIRIKSAKMEEMRSVRGLLALINGRPAMAAV
jgi:acyl carrier protein